MVLYVTFNNISVISWQYVLLVEETGVPGENHWPAVSHWQTWSPTVASSTPHDECDIMYVFYRNTRYKPSDTKHSLVYACDTRCTTFMTLPVRIVGKTQWLHKYIWNPTDEYFKVTFQMFVSNCRKLYHSLGQHFYPSWFGLVHGV